MISVEEALAACLVLARPVGTERLRLAEAGGRVLAESVIARRDQPPFAASAMDGYALRAADRVAGAVLRVVGEAPAGRAWDGVVGAREALRIFTGAPVPRGADCVVIQEDVTRDGDRIVLGDRLEAASNIRPEGADFRAGARIEAPRRLSPADLALCASMNVPELVVSRRPEVALIATGDELVSPGEVPRDDQIVASNSYGLKAMVEAEGARARLLPIARDDRESLAQVLRLAAGADLVVTIGGASVGDHDLVGEVAAAMGLERAFYKVAMRPGKPLMAGRLGGAVLLGLPGNPVSAMVCGHIFLVPMLRAMMGLPAGARRRFPARLGCDLPANGPREHYLRSDLMPGNDFPEITPYPSQDSSLLTVLSDANALLVRAPEDPPRRAGEIVDYLPLVPLFA
ncbi:gephyrin-like molybdotransferase Glp [Roseicyclus persicicus]|uniref:Molybdopterin molybdenumtransferase n=1 Tax=Roseicyclus persicicus TaxID=2650661 RepID=A0A7X6H0K6_9RHOB|nr:gephyrin-like molybdotransferase Glp [Roseibacterium persicicum]NKX45812.1 molybdopterin molybdotransferase MoeA [Roseibacterium persicicum]